MRLKKDEFGNMSAYYNDFTEDECFKSDILVRNVRADIDNAKNIAREYIRKNNLTKFALFYNAEFDLLGITYN